MHLKNTLRYLTIFIAIWSPLERQGYFGYHTRTACRIHGKVCEDQRSDQVCNDLSFGHPVRCGFRGCTSDGGCRPMLANIFVEAKMQLPLPTRIVMAISNF